MSEWCIESRRRRWKKLESDDKLFISFVTKNRKRWYHERTWYVIGQPVSGIEMSFKIIIRSFFLYFLWLQQWNKTDYEVGYTMVVVVETLVWADFIRTLTTTSKMNNSNNVNNIKRRQRQLPFRKATEIQIVFVSLKTFLHWCYTIRIWAKSYDLKDWLICLSSSKGCPNTVSRLFWALVFRCKLIKSNTYRHHQLRQRGYCLILNCNKF